MAIESVDTLLAVLRRTQLFAPDQVDEVARELGPHYDDPQALAEHLVQIEWLTPYQFEKLFAGEWELLAIGPYTLLDRLGEGGVSEVYKAWDTLRGQVVALKVLRQHLTAQHEAVRQFQRELQAMPRLNHPNVIRTYEAHQLGAVHYFAMEYVEGMDLEKYVQTVGPLPVEIAADYVRQVAQGLQHAHQFGLVHRDVKPANLFLINPPLPVAASAGSLRRGPDPVVKILDWGLARIQLSADEAREVDVAELGSEKGVLIGTADYVSPEQARDATIVDTRGDIYGLGCTFVYLLTGQPPFPSRTLMQKLMQHQQAPPPSVRSLRPDVPEELDHLIQKMMAKMPADRFQIPLLVIAPLRKFGPAATVGSVVRTPGSGVHRAISRAAKPAANRVDVRPAVAPGAKPAPTNGNFPRHGGNGSAPRS